MTTANARKVTFSTPTTWDKFVECEKELNACLIERRWQIKMALTAMAARQHCLLIGPPGCAKSLVFDSLINWLDGPTFSELLHRAIPADLLMGAPSLKIYREKDLLVRKITGMLPAAVLAFLDEIWKASPMTLTPLMKVINERKHMRLGKWLKSPLHSMFAASNEYPPDNDNGIDSAALFDRFLIRGEVEYVKSKDGLKRLFAIPVKGKPKPRMDLTPNLDNFKITPDELTNVHKETLNLEFSDDAERGFFQIIDALEVATINPGDRRKHMAPRVAMAYAWLNGHSQVEREDLEILKYVLWTDHREHPSKVNTIVSEIANPIGTEINACARDIQMVVDKVDVKNEVSRKDARAKLDDISIRLRVLKDQRAVDMLRDVSEIQRNMSLGGITTNVNFRDYIK